MEKKGGGSDLRYTSASDLIGFLSPLPGPKINPFLDCLPDTTRITWDLLLAAACFTAGPTAVFAPESRRWVPILARQLTSCAILPKACAPEPRSSSPRSAGSNSIQCQESGCSLEGSSASEVACKAVKCQPGLRASGEAAASELIRMVVGWIEFLTGWRLPSVPSTQTSSQGSSQDVSLLPHGKQEERENEQNDHSNLLYLNLGNGILSPLLRCVLAASLWVQCTLRGSGLYQEQLAAGRATGGHRELAYSWTATCFLMQRPAHLQAQSRHRPNAYGQAAAKQEWRLTS
ncbi:uncharacterized protein LOC123785054 [Ursus americanus]|uniref:uncharacterized protein LOC123785054 n=1 Tax=Ursus americanus TaxID=9643 RepID=UPI001E67A274|nr:uncharacterized protein LOC123785054 [Ursus americanus]